LLSLYCYDIVDPVILEIAKKVSFLVSLLVGIWGQESLRVRAAAIENPESTSFYAQNFPGEDRQLRVGIAGEPPSIVVTEGQLGGITVEYWQELAEELNLNYRLIAYPTVETSLAALDNDEIDLALGSISITSDRIAQYDFTQPISQGNLTVLLPTEAPSLWSTLKPFLAWGFLSSVGGIFLSLFIVGNLLWLAERRDNDQFPKTYRQGVHEGMWCAVATFATVGYGDRVPITYLGRTIAAVWMILSLVIVTSLTAGIATTLAIAFSNRPAEQLSQPQDLAGARIAAVEQGSPAEAWAQFYQARVSVTETLEEAITLLESKRVDGVINTRLALEYYLHQNPKTPYRLANFNLGPQPYGIALPLNSPLTQKLNEHILQLPTQLRLQQIRQTWFQSLEEFSEQDSPGSHKDSVSPSL
jgi:polar amino acid transport system substrate-binding protein